MTVKRRFIFSTIFLFVSFFVLFPKNTNAQTFISPTPAASSWNDDPSITVAIDDPPGVILCWYDVRRSGLLVLDDAVRTCDWTFSVQVGATSDCSIGGFDTCEVTAFARDGFGGITSNARLFSIDYSDPTGMAPMHSPVSVNNTTPSVAINSSTFIFGGSSGIDRITVNAVIDVNNNGRFDDAGPLNNTCAFANNCFLTITGPFVIGNKWLYYMTAIDGAGNFVSTDSTPGSFLVSAAQPPQPIDQPPTANFTYTISNLTVTFTDSSTPGTNPITTWQWKFGDNTPDILSNSANPQIHTYKHPRVYAVKLTVIDNGGLQNQKELSLDLLGGSPDPANPSSEVSRVLRAPLNCTSLTDCLDAFITFILVISTPLLILLIVYAAVVIMIGGASPSMRATAINTVRFALIGYIIMLLAKIILGVITGALF